MPAQLNAFVAQHPPDRGGRNAERGRQGTAIPPGQPWRRRQFQLPHKAQAHLRTVFRFLAWPRLIAQPGQTAGRKSLAPQTDRVWPHPKRARDLVISLTIKAGKNDLGTLDQASFRATAAGKVDQFGSLFGRTRQSHRDPGHQTPQMVLPSSMTHNIAFQRE